MYPINVYADTLAGGYIVSRISIIIIMPVQRYRRKWFNYTRSGALYCSSRYQKPNQTNSILNIKLYVFEEFHYLIKIIKLNRII